MLQETNLEVSAVEAEDDLCKRLVACEKDHRSGREKQDSGQGARVHGAQPSLQQVPPRHTQARSESLLLALLLPLPWPLPLRRRWRWRRGGRGGSHEVRCKVVKGRCKHSRSSSCKSTPQRSLQKQRYTHVIERREEVLVHVKKSDLKACKGHVATQHRRPRDEEGLNLPLLKEAKQSLETVVALARLQLFPR